MVTPPSEVTFGLSPSYGIHTARDAHEWFMRVMREHEEFEVETDKEGEPPLSFWTELPCFSSCQESTAITSTNRLDPQRQMTLGRSLMDTTPAWPRSSPREVLLLP